MIEGKTLICTRGRYLSPDRLWRRSFGFFPLKSIRLINILQLLRCMFKASLPFFLLSSPPHPPGEVKLLLSSETPIEGRKLSFVNDLTVTRDGRKIYFTDSSSKWQRRDYLLLVMEGTDDGR